MALHFTPWVALILGILIGLVLEWLLELFFWRRQRLECQRRLAKVEAAVKDREAQIKNVRAHIESLNSDLAKLRGNPGLTR